MIIGIIGGGASGMAAAIAAAQWECNEVILFERQARLGRKLQATGNGRCNLSNLNMDLQHYHGDAPAFAAPALDRFGVEETLHWFRDLGLCTVCETTGRVYPYSDQANSVVDVLRFALENPHIQVKTGVEVTRVKKTGDVFLVETAEETVRCDRLIIACGGLAGTKLGGSLSGYSLLRSFGHRCSKLRPNLVQIKSDWSGCASLKGVRANCTARILCDGIVHSVGSGELQFTEMGLSGPVIFELSRDVCQKKGYWTCRLDLLPQLTGAELLQMLEKKRHGKLLAEELLTGILHNRLGRVICKAVGINASKPIGALTDLDLEAVCRAVKDFEIHLTEPLGMDAAQVTAGGIVTAEFDPHTMESRLVPGLFACGEVLDIDGDCGGYNLQWAWSSGRLAGESAGAP